MQRDLEAVKIDLVLKQDFNLSDGFALLDLDKCGYVNAPQLTASLEEVLQMERISRDDMALLLKKFDSDYDGRLTYFDFEKAVAPVSEEYASILMNRTSHY